MDEYQRRRRDLEQREQALAGQERQLEAQVDRQAEIAQLGLSTEEFCRRVSQGLERASWEQRRQLIEWLVARVVVIDGDVEIRYVIPTNPAGKAPTFVICVQTIEAAMSRWKQVVGDELRAHADKRWATEVAVAVHALNRMPEPGRPSYVRMA